MTVPERIARQVVAHGRVQGVFFRDACCGEAQEAGVDGWVSNEDDGTVRAHVEGPAADVERLVAWMAHGSRQARVERVEVSDVAPEGMTGFEVR